MKDEKLAAERARHEEALKADMEAFKAKQNGMIILFYK